MRRIWSSHGFHGGHGADQRIVNSGPSVKDSKDQNFEPVGNQRNPEAEKRYHQYMVSVLFGCGARLD